MGVLAIGLAISILSPERAEAREHPLAFFGETDQYTLLRSPRPAPLKPIRTGTGGVTNLSRFQGKVVLVNFWATWCAPCIREMPSLDRLQAKLGGDRFTVIPLSIDRESIEVLRSFYEGLAIRNLGIYRDPNEVSFDAFGRWALPLSYIIDRKGRIQGYLKGAANWDSEDALRLLGYYME